MLLAAVIQFSLLAFLSWLLQMHYARKGVVSEEMAFVAAREGLDPEYVRSEVSKPVSLVEMACKLQDSPFASSALRWVWSLSTPIVALLTHALLAVPVAAGGEGQGHHPSQQEAPGAGTNQ